MWPHDVTLESVLIDDILERVRRMCVHDACNLASTRRSSDALDSSLHTGIRVVDAVSYVSASPDVLSAISLAHGPGCTLALRSSPQRGGMATARDRCPQFARPSTDCGAIQVQAEFTSNLPRRGAPNPARPRPHDDRYACALVSHRQKRPASSSFGAANGSCSFSPFLPSVALGGGSGAASDLK